MGAGAGWTAEGPLGPSLAVVLGGRRPLETHPLGAGDMPGGNSAWALAAACACLPVAVGGHRQRKAPREVTFNAFQKAGLCRFEIVSREARSSSLKKECFYLMSPRWFEP